MDKSIPPIVERNKDVEHIMLASAIYGVNGRGKKNVGKLFSMLAMADVHQSYAQMESAIDYLNYYDVFDIGICLGDIAEDLLAHILGPTIGVGAVACLGSLTQGHFVIPGVDGGGGREHDLLHTMLCHDAAQGHGRAQIVLIITQRDGAAFADSLETCEMDDAIDGIFCEDLFQDRFVANIAFIELDSSAGDLTDTVKALCAGIIQIIDHDGGVTCFDQFHTSVAADITGAAGD